ncbi:MAG: copper-binding protein [Rhizorhabdus sp.]|uniref:copper-binding protein n=1 Tax=Rhizorhabdus sp. TaxID=1968843 RepID=UPI001B653D9B|nr:copper-binding protein [Rhizorhabdus sp.]MBP8231235.1 copper-binding protein [Rhizorhabdus sp.]
MKTKLMIAVAAALISTGTIAMPALAHQGEDHAPAPQTAEGQGTVKAVDAKAGTITIAHGPIAALKWPAMTMKFKVEKASILNGVAVGKKIHFVLKNIGGKPVVTEIHIM